MAGADLAISLLIILVFMNYRLSRSVLYPPFIFCTMWLLDMSLYRLQLVEMDTIHPETFLVVSTGAVLFSLGGVATLLVPSSLIKTRFVMIKNKPDRTLRVQQRSNWIKYLIIFTCAIGVCIIVRHTFSLGANGVGGTVLARARNAGVESANEGGGQFPVLEYILLWSIYIAVLFHSECQNLSSWIMVGIAFIGCIFSSSRAEILLLIAALTCVHLMKTNRLSFIAAIRFIRWPLLLFTFLWIALIFTNKNTDAFGSSVGGIILIFLVNYIVGPVVALDYVLRHPTEYVGLPNHTFKFFLSIASSFHLIPYTPPPGFDAFVSVPFPTNVYTVYKYFVTDFGLFGALGVMMLIGFLHTLLYRKARTGSELAIYWFALTMFPVIMVIFDEQYAAFGSYIDMLLVGILCIFLRSEPMLRLPRIQRRIIS